MSEKVKEFIGTSLVELVPTDDNIIVKATAMNTVVSCLAETQDANEVFTYEVVGFGNAVEDIKLNDIVSIMPHALNQIVLSDNKESFKDVVRHIKKLTNKEREALPTRVNFTEYFICKRYAIQGIVAVNDNSINSLHKAKIDGDNISSNSDTE